MQVCHGVWLCDSRFATLRRVLTRLQLERGQVLIYLVAIAIGAILGIHAD